MYNHPPLFVGLYFVVLQNHRVTKRMRLKQNFQNNLEGSRDSNNSLSHTTWCSWSWRKRKRSCPSHRF